MAKKPTVDEMADAIGSAIRAATGQYQDCTPTTEEKYALDVARVGFMSACPFYAHYFYAEMREVFTYDIPTAATDGRNILINPKYLAGLKPAERIFVYAHEVDHAISKHPSRGKHYRSEGTLRGHEWDAQQANIMMDYVINAGLLENGIGMMNPSWMYADDVTGEDLWEDVYERKYKKNPGGQGKGTTYGQSGKAPKGAKGDPAADAQGGAFDTIFDPPTDPATGQEDLPSEAEFKEAIARAAAAAKAQGKLPGSLQRKVDQILEPQVDWREHVRMLMTGKIGSRSETWDRPNRRRLALNPLVIIPGRRGFGADTVAVAIDTSGSIGERELNAFFSEVGGVLADVRPKRVVLIHCDAAINRVDEANTLDELNDIRAKGACGGGGTSFIPVFDYIEKEHLKPEALIYITDMYGSFPDKAPAYPVIWCKTTDVEPPFGDSVKIVVK
jgi:predicted metal-dependent peptidase